VQCLVGNGEQWSVQSRSAADGTFRAVGCPPDVPLTVIARAQGFEELRRTGVAPAAEPLRLQLQRALPATARIVGVIVGPDGKPLANATITPLRRGSNYATGLQASGPDGRFATALLVPGSWTLIVGAPPWPTFVSEPLELGADAVCDVGTVRMEAGGNVRVVVDGEHERTRFLVTDGTRHTSSTLHPSEGALASDPLRPGEYRLLVSGEDTAAQSIPVTVRAGATTSLTVRPSRGVRQGLAIAAAMLDPLPPSVRIEVRAGGELLAVAAVRLTGGESAFASLCLRPGEYALTAMAGDREVGSCTFTVGEQEGPAVPLTLR
jgi:hypothetical protein